MTEDDSEKPALSFLSIRNKRGGLGFEKHKAKEIAEDIEYKESREGQPGTESFEGSEASLRQKILKEKVGTPISDPRLQKPSQNLQISQPIHSLTRKPTPTEPDEEDFDFTKYLALVITRRWWFLGTFAVVFLIGLVINLMSPVFYQSQATLAIKSSPLRETFSGLLLGKNVSDENSATEHIQKLKNPPEELVSAIQNHLDSDHNATDVLTGIAAQPTGDKGIILIVSTHSNPKMSEKFADAVVAGYEDFDLMFRQKKYSEQENWIREQIIQRKAILEALEIKIKEFLQNHPTFTGSTQGSLGGNLSSIETQLRELGLRLEEDSHRLILVKKALKLGDSVVVAEVTRDKPLQKELLNLEVELARLRVEHGEENRKVQKTLDQMRNIKSLILKDAENKSYTTILQANPHYQELLAQKTELEQNLSVMNTRKVELEKYLETSYKETSTQPELQLEFARMERDKSASEKIYTMLSEKLEETRLQKSGVAREVYQLGKSTPAKKIQSSKVTLTMALLVALLLAFIVCIIVENLDKSIRFPVEIEKNFGIPVLGIIPELSLGNNRLNLDSDSKIIEPYRNLRTNLNYSVLGARGETKAIIITSALQGEGKSTKAVNLAICFSLDGQKVLLVDADLRRPSVHGLLNQERGPGFSEFLTGQVEFSGVVQKTQYHNLNIVSAGNKMPNPAEILGSPNIFSFLEQAKAQYDVVFFDSPAIFPVSDALVLAPRMDGALVVFRSNYTPLKAGQDVLRKLNQVGANVVGSVLNNVHTGKGGYYYSYYGYYGYSYYHNYYEDAHPNTRHPFLYALKQDMLKKVEAAQNYLGRNKKPEEGVTKTIIPKKNWFSWLTWIYIGLGVLLAISGSYLVYWKAQKPPEFIPLADSLSVPNHKKIKIDPAGRFQDSLIILENLDSWERSLESINLELYLSHYSVLQFLLNNKTFDDWKNSKAEYFSKIQSFQLERGPVEWEWKNKGTVVTKFKQTNLINEIPSDFTKVIYWKKEESSWKITREGILK